jgi:hypothetical protein
MLSRVWNGKPPLMVKVFARRKNGPAVARESQRRRVTLDWNPG